MELILCKNSEEIAGIREYFWMTFEENFKIWWVILWNFEKIVENTEEILNTFWWHWSKN